MQTLEWKQVRPSLGRWLFCFWRESFCVFGKSAPTDAKGIISNLMFAVKSTHQPRHTEREADYPRGADALLIVFLITSVSETLKQMFYKTVWWCQMEDGDVLHLHPSCVSFLSPLCSGWGLLGWLNILWFSRASEIYLSNLGECVCVSREWMQLHMHDENGIKSWAWIHLAES